MYILKNPRNKIYTGCSQDVEKRIMRHANGQGAKFTKQNKDFILVYKEEYTSLLEARRREKQIKGWRREKKENLIKFGKPIV